MEVSLPSCLLPNKYILNGVGLTARRNEGREEGCVLFNDAFNTLCLRLLGVGHMVKDHTDSERGNPLPPHGLLFPISSKGSFIWTIPQAGQHIPRPFVTPVVEHWLEREIAQWAHHEGSIRWPIAPWANALTTELHLAPRRNEDDSLNEGCSNPVTSNEFDTKLC